MLPGGSDRSSPVNNINDNIPMDDILQPSTSVPQTPKTPKSNSKSKLLNSITKSIGSKTPPRMGLMRSPSSSKQPPAMNKEPSGEVHSGNTLENYVLPHSLRMDTVDVNAAQGGMDVIKVSKVSCLRYCIVCLTEVFVKCVLFRMDLCFPSKKVSHEFLSHSFRMESNNPEG